jgi:hypothetical protein
METTLNTAEVDQKVDVPLFASFTRLLQQIAAGAVVREELDRGVFIFGCTREHALSPGASGEDDERNWVRCGIGGSAAYEILLPALRQAESEGRVGWARPVKGQNIGRYTVLAEILIKFNCLDASAEIPPDHEFFADNVGKWLDSNSAKCRLHWH